MRDRLIELIRNAPRTDTVYGDIKLPDPVQTVQTIADHLLANDTVAVVRCKDCDFCVGPEDMCGNIYCRMHMGRFDENAFCSYSRRRTENDE